MTRLTADGMRQLAKSARKAKTAAERAQAVETRRNEAKASQDLARRLQLWEIFLTNAINGHDSIELENLCDDDLKYFISSGFTAKKTYTRLCDQNILTNELEKLQNLLENLEDEESRLSFEIHGYVECGFDSTPFEGWILDNGETAFVCDLEEWFGEDLNCVSINDVKSLEALERTLEKKMVSLRAVSPHKVRLKLLSRLVNNAFLELQNEGPFRRKNPALDYDPSRNAKEIQRLNDEIFTIKQKLTEIESQEDYLRNRDVKTAHLIMWKARAHRTANCYVEGYDQASLQWLCSPIGQKAFESFEADVKKISEEGNRSITLVWASNNPEFTVSHKDGEFTATFPNWLCFRHSLTILKYKVGIRKTKPNQIVTIKW